VVAVVVFVNFLRCAFKQEHHPEWLIRACMRFEMLELALELSLSLIHRVRAAQKLFRLRCISSSSHGRDVRRQAESRFAQDPPKTAMATWLPYTLIDQLLVATNEQTQSDLSQRAIGLRRDLHKEVSNGARRSQKLSHRLYQEL
jgi:nuclear pore complex protein Nup160